MGLIKFLKSLFSNLNESGQVPSSLTDSYDALLTTTLRNMMDAELRDNISRSNKVLGALKKAGRVRTEDGGERIQVPLMHALNSTADIYTGYGNLDTTPQDGITSAFFNWSQLAGSISISRLEERQNSGEHKKINLLKSKTMQSMVSVKELLNNCIVAGRITASAASGQFLQRIGRLDSGALGPLPLAALIDVTNSRNAAIGNINPNTYAFWRNQSTSSTASTFAGMKQEMNQVYNDCSKGSGGNPNMLIGDQRVHEQYFNSLQNQERYVVESPRVLDLLGGSDVLKFRGAEFVWDEVVPDTETTAEVVDGIGTVSASTLFYLNTECMEYVVDRQTDFITTDFIRPVGQDAKVAQILWMGAVVINNRRKLGTLYGIARNIVA